MTQIENARLEAIRAFLAGAGWGGAARTPLPADASTRRYMRLKLGDRTAMLMDQPQSAEASVAPAEASPEERRAHGYNALARLAGADCARFVAAAHYLANQGLSAPEIYAVDEKAGLVLLEDLGDDPYTTAIAAGADEAMLYAAAVDVLIQLHRQAAPATLAPGKMLFVYDETALLAETDLLTQWFLPLALRRPADPEEIEEHRALWRAALSEVGSAPRVFVHRDYHAQNLMWIPARREYRRVGLIDFQDAVAGAPAYDLVSLLQDARRDVPAELAEAMTARYLARSDTFMDAQSFRAQAALLATQRNAKIVGIFARLATRDSKPRYLAYLPRVWRHMAHDLAHPELAKLKAWYDRKLPEDRRAPSHGQGAPA